MRGAAGATAAQTSIRTSSSAARRSTSTTTTSTSTTATGGPAFIKTNAYAPYPVWVYLNGHEWAKRQAAQAGIEFRALDNGFAACDDADALAAICARLGHADVQAFFARWIARAAVAVHRRRARHATATGCRSASSSCPTPASSIARPPAAPGLSRRCATSSTSDTPTASRSSSGARSRARPPALSDQGHHARRRSR